MTRRPPKFPLFPSPPLFRSRVRALPVHAQRRGDARQHRVSRDQHPVRRAKERDVSRRVPRRPREPPSDRKSTRLNSSHANLVCRLLLEKKKKNTKIKPTSN